MQRYKTFTDEFDSIDVSGDNVIQREELELALLKRYPEATIDEARAWAHGVMRLADRDGNGVIDRAEFRAFMNQRYDALRTLFGELDVTQTGYLSKKDVKVALQAANVPHLEADVERVLKRLDAGGHGGVREEGVDFHSFFRTVVLLPVHGSESLLVLTTAGAYPLAMPPPGTTPFMIVAAVRHLSKALVSQVALSGMCAALCSGIRERGCLSYDDSPDGPAEGCARHGPLPRRCVPRRFTAGTRARAAQFARATRLTSELACRQCKND